jgi:hypothetical protein
MGRHAGWARALSLTAAAALALGAAPPLEAAQIEADSETIFRVFERDDDTVLPVYEYLRVAGGALDDKGFSVHAYGWGRYNFGDDYYDDDAQGEVLYGYLEYTLPTLNFAARLGRQYVFEGVANESVDGLAVRGDAGPFFSASAYAGQPVSLEEVDGRDSDSIWGGRIGHHLGSLYEVGLSYKRLENDGDLAQESLGIDSSVQFSFPVSLRGYSVRNLDTDDWSEHSYEARVSVKSLLLRPFFQRFDYDAFFDAGAKTPTVFRFLEGSGETVETYGADLTWFATANLDLELKAKKYAYDERDDDAWYWGGLATLRFSGLSQVGGEVGGMDGGTSDTQYILWRGFFYWDAKPAFLSGDVVWVSYDQDINGEDASTFVSLGAGERFLKDALEVRLSGDYSADPYFDEDVRGMLTVKYRFSR